MRMALLPKIRLAGPRPRRQPCGTAASPTSTEEGDFTSIVRRKSTASYCRIGFDLATRPRKNRETVPNLVEFLCDSRTSMDNGAPSAPHARAATDEPPARPRDAVPQPRDEPVRPRAPDRAVAGDGLEPRRRAAPRRRRRGARGDERAAAQHRTAADPALARARRGVRRRPRLRPPAHPRRRLRPLGGAGRRRLVGRGGRPRADREPRPRARARAARRFEPRGSTRTGCSASAWASRRRSTA